MIVYYEELVVVHLPDDKDATKIIPVPAVVLHPGEKYTTVRLRKGDICIELDVQTDLLSER